MIEVLERHKLEEKKKYQKFSSGHGKCEAPSGNPLGGTKSKAVESRNLELRDRVRNGDLGKNVEVVHERGI